MRFGEWLTDRLWGPLPPVISELEARERTAPLPEGELGTVTVSPQRPPIDGLHSGDGLDNPRADDRAHRDLPLEDGRL